MYLDQRTAKIAHQRHARGLVVDEDARTAISRLDTAQDDVAIVVYGVFGKERARGMPGGDVEHGSHLPLRRAMPHKSDVATRAEGKREGVKQDRLAGAGFARQHRKPLCEVDVQLLDQDDVADGKARKHDRVFGRSFEDGPEQTPAGGFAKWAAKRNLHKCGGRRKRRISAAAPVTTLSFRRRLAAEL